MSPFCCLLLQLWLQNPKLMQLSTKLHCNLMLSTDFFFFFLATEIFSLTGQMKSGLCSKLGRLTSMSRKELV